MSANSHPPPLDAAQERALALLRAARRVLLTGHVRPDGDCIGAQAALALGLRALGKDVAVLNPDPVEPQFDYLTRFVDYGVYRGGDVFAHDLTVLLDAAELSRCGPLGERLAALPSKKLVVDHHVHEGAAWWDEAFVDVRAAATGLLVRRVLQALGVALDERMAAGVFTSLVTDTGWFKYSNTDQESFAAAAEALAAGVRPHELYASIYQRYGKDHPRGVARALSTLEYHAAGRLAVVLVPPPAAGEAALGDGDVVLDLLRAVESVEVVLLLRTNAEGAVKVSARSKSDFDVNRLLRRFGGGGHVKAAGATITGDIERIKGELAAAAVAELAASAPER